MDDDEFDIDPEVAASGIPFTWADIPSALLGVVGRVLEGAADGLLEFKRIFDLHSLYVARRKVARDLAWSEGMRDIEAIVAPKEK